MAQHLNTPDIIESGTKKPLINRDFVLITLSSFFFFFNFHSFILLPIRIEDLGGSESIIGFIMGSAAMATILTTPAVGIFIDKWGKKWFLAFGGLLMALTTIPFAYLDTLNFLFPLLRILQGASLSLCFVSAGTLVADVSAPERRSQAMGIFGMFSILNFALAPLVGKIVLESYGFQDFFKFDGAFGLLAFLMAVFVREPVTLKEDHEDYKKTGGFIKALTRKGVIQAAFILMVSGSGFVTVISFIPVFASRIKVEAFELFFLAYSGAVIAIRVFGGWMPDKYGYKKVSVPALFLFSLSILSLSFASGASSLVLSGIFFGLGQGLFYPAIYALIIDLSLESDRGKAVSICSVSFTFGGMLGVFLYGVVAELWGFNLMFVASGLVCLLGSLIFSFTGRGR
jgi:MFS family permease